ncbi:LLM class flavin-dependent oxidoreductase [Micromonospora sp. KC207]|nr:LLM class flavin-dependent oxidoreductase [Micromonospora sp. KC207]
MVSLAAVAAVTERIRLGTSIAWALGRTPIMLATDFRSLDELAPGRVSMGLGTGNPQVIEQWHGLDAPHPVARLVEIVDIVRQAWRVHERPVAFEGKFYRCHLDADPTLPPPGADTLPILLAGGRRPLLRQAGAVADGLVGMPMCSAAFVEQYVRPTLAEGTEAAGREGAVPIRGMVITAVDDDATRARRAAAMQVAIYATRRSADPLLRFYGFEEPAAAIREAFARRDLPGMAAAVPDRMLGVLAVFGTPQEARERYRAPFETVYDEPLLYASGKGVPAAAFRANLQAICEVFAPARS